ncbi:hypothetical protein FRC03_004820 [Tulasnella sp. 419]|nr:hypothetical protein FRC03_004820 [Tulasnella sp. 419]
MVDVAGNYNRVANRDSIELKYINNELGKLKHLNGLLTFCATLSLRVSPLQPSNAPSALRWGKAAFFAGMIGVLTEIFAITYKDAKTLVRVRNTARACAVISASAFIWSLVLRL